jgi:hypothetical protein
LNTSSFYHSLSSCSFKYVTFLHQSIFHSTVAFCSPYLSTVQLQGNKLF